MVNIKPTIEIYDNEGNLSKTYNKAINKMIDQIFDIDLEQFDFDEVAKGKCKEFDDLVTKLCAKSGLGSDDIYSMFLERFEAEYDMYLLDVYGLDELEESKKSLRKSLKERKKFQYGDEVINFLENYGYYKRGEDFEQYEDYSTVTYMYAIPKGMRPQTPYVEFTVDADNDAFIFGEYFTDGRKGYSTEFDSVEDLEYFVSNANYENVDLTETHRL